MLILTLKTRRLIDRAMNTYGSDHQREVWRAFVRAHPDVRRGPADGYEDGAGAFPPEAGEVVRSVLNQMFDATERRAKSSSLSEDEIADLSDDLAFIRSVMKTLNRYAPRNASVSQGISV
jgi:hypothetical protein